MIKNNIMIKRLKILFIIKSYVDLDNFLPILSEFNFLNDFYEVFILNLDFDPHLIERKWFGNISRDINVLDQNDFIESPFLRRAFSINSKFCKLFKFKKIKRLAVLACKKHDQLWKGIFSNSIIFDEEKFNKYDLYFT